MSHTTTPPHVFRKDNMFGIKVAIGAMIVSARFVRRHLVAFLVGAILFGAMSSNAATSHVVTHDNIQGNVRMLMHACVPMHTGGGVTQCAQPTTFDLAFLACMRNDAYIGVTQDDTRHLFVQCVDDFMRMNGWR